MYKPSTIIAVLLILILFAPIMTISIAPKSHWLSLVTTTYNTIDTNITSIDYEGGYIYAVISDGSGGGFGLVKLNGDEGYTETLYTDISGNEYNEYVYKDTLLGNPTYIDASANGIFVGTDNGKLLVIDPNDYSVTNALYLYDTDGNPLKIKYIYYDNGYINIAGIAGGKIHDVVIDTTTYGITSEFNIDGNDVFWIYNELSLGVINKVYVYYLDDNNDPYISIATVTLSGNDIEAQIDMYRLNQKSELTVLSSINPIPTFDPNMNYMLVPLPLLNTTTNDILTYIYKIDLSTGKVVDYYSFSIMDVNVSIVRLFIPGDGWVYLYGDINDPTSDTGRDILFGKYNKSNEEVYAWTIGGSYADCTNNGGMSTYGDGYFFAGANTRSFGDNNVRFSSFVALVSSNLVSGDQYKWTSQPQYSAPQNGAIASEYSLGISEGMEPSYISSSTTLVELILSSDYSLSSAGYSDINNYVGYTENSIPVPVPENALLSLIGIIVGVVAFYIVFSRKRK